MEVAVHKLLDRQLRRHFGDQVPPSDLEPLLQAIDRSYSESDQDRALVERSLELASQEMLSLNTGLQQQKEELRLILDSVPAAIFFKDKENRIVNLNEAGARVFGLARDQVEGKSTYDLLPRPVAKALHDDDLAVIETGLPRMGIEEAHPSADGAIHWYRTDKVPHRNSKGEIDGVIVLSADITQVKRASMTIQLLHRVPLLANEAPTMEEATRLSLQCVCDYTGWPAGHALFVNESGTELVGRNVWHVAETQRADTLQAATAVCSIGPGIGVPGRVWEGRHPAWTSNLVRDGADARAAAAEDCGLVATFAFPVLVHERVVAVLEFFAANLGEPDPDLLRIMENVGEQLGRVLERRGAEAELKAAYEQLKEVDRARIQFINTAAHELGTPLTPIKIQVEMVKNRLDAQTPPQQRKSVEILERNIDRLTHLVKDLLDSARLQTGKLLVAPQRTNLATETVRAVEAYRQMADAQGIRLTVDASAGPLDVIADVRRLGQVLDNLLTNAVKFTPKQGKIIVTVAQREGQAIVRVRDTGIGLAPEAHARLFQPFSQVHDTMQITAPGTGLGLYISKGIIQALGGEIDCESPGLGQGTTFWFSLPLAGPAAPAGAAGPAGTAASAGAAAPTGPARPATL